MTETATPLDLGAAITRLTTAVGERVLAVRAASGLSAVQLQVLRLAADEPTIATLTRILGTPKSTMTSVLNQLESSGLAERASDPGDRRRQVVHLTTRGRARLRAFDHALEAQVESMLNSLSSANTRRLEVLLTTLPSASVPIPLSGPS